MSIIDSTKNFAGSTFEPQIQTVLSSQLQLFMSKMNAVNKPVPLESPLAATFI